jgi:glycosyltransferase involved in cell wall biosynthesis
MSDMLLDMDIEAACEVAIDNNCIDRLVTQHKPTHVVIEALWVVPSKFAILSKLHPTVTWIIRIHSEMPFMANEGMAMDWIADYSKHPNIVIAPNAPRMLKELRYYLQVSNNWTKAQSNQKVVYLPNYYPLCVSEKKHTMKQKEHIDICCFGAVRPLKNHLLQAHAALQFAEKIGKKLRFHINVGRLENRGDPVLNNLKGMFEALYHSGHQLIGHGWTPREEFIERCHSMDIGMQASLTETFNIVGADYITSGVPIVGDANEIPWLSRIFSAKGQSSDAIVQKLLWTYYFPEMNVSINSYKLNKYCNQTKQVWFNYFKGK